MTFKKSQHDICNIDKATKRKREKKRKEKLIRNIGRKDRRIG